MLRVAICMGAVLLASATLYADPKVGNGGVWIRLNGGSNEVLLEADNTLEVLIENDATISELRLGFEITWNSLLNVTWNDSFGDRPPVQQHNGAADVFTLAFSVDDRFDDVTPDSVGIAGAAIVGGLPPEAARLCYSLQFYASSSTSTDLVDGFCIDNIGMPPYGSWSFLDAGGYYAPDFNGFSNAGTNWPTAPPICFDIVLLSYICGDCNGDGTVNVSDAVYLITYIFGDGPPPEPLAAGNLNCDGTANVSDVVYMITYIFGGGPPPCDVDDDGSPDC